MHNLQITLKKSTCLISLYTSLYLLALCVPILGLFQHWLKPWLALLCLGIVFFHAVRTTRMLMILPNKTTPQGLSWDPQLGWRLHFAHEKIQAQLCHDSVMTSGLLLLHFKTERHRFRIPMLIAKDSIPSDDFRRCQLTIKYAKDKPAH